MLESSRMQQAWMVYSHLDLHSPQHLPAKVCSTAHTETRKASRAHLRLHVHPCRRDVYPYRIHGNALGGDCNADWGDRDGTWADRKACVSELDRRNCMRIRKQDVRGCFSAQEL